MKQVLLFTAMMLFQTFSYGQTYCTPTFRSNDINNHYISNVKLSPNSGTSAALLNNSTSKSTSGYTFYSSSTPTNVKINSSYLVNVNTVSNPAKAVLLGYLDLNRDGIFSSNEIFMSSIGASSAQSSFFIPTIPNGILRMRIVLTEDLPYSPCGPYTLGEVEDYSLIIVDCATITTYPTSDFNYCSNKQVTLHIGYTGPSAGVSNMYWYIQHVNASGGIYQTDGPLPSDYTFIPNEKLRLRAYLAFNNGCSTQNKLVIATPIQCRMGETNEINSISSTLNEGLLEIINLNKEDLQVNLASIDGKLIVEKSTLEEKFSLNVKNLQGIYILDITTSNGDHITKKIVINN